MKKYIKDLSTRDIKTTTNFCLSKSYQIMHDQVTSVFHLRCTKIYTETILTFRPWKLGWKRCIKTTSIFCSSKLRRTKCIKTKSIFRSSKLHSRKYIKTTSIFRLWNYFGEDTSRRLRFLAHWKYIKKVRQSAVEIYQYFLFDVRRNMDTESTSIRHVVHYIVSLTKGELRWLTNMSFTDSRFE